MPRSINVICETALVYAFADNASQFSADLVDIVLADKAEYGVLPPISSDDETACVETGIHDSGETIRNTLSNQMRATISVLGEHGEQIHIRISSYPNAHSRCCCAPWSYRGIWARHRRPSFRRNHKP